MVCQLTDHFLYVGCWFFAFLVCYNHKYYPDCKWDKTDKEEYNADHACERKTYWRCRCAEQIVVFFGIFYAVYLCLH